MENQNTTLLNIYGAKISKDNKKVVLTLVSGEGESKTFYSACVKLDNTQKTHVKLEEDGQHAIFKVVMIKEKEEQPF